MGFSIDIDTGGTFTDGFFSHGTLGPRAIKVNTTPHDLTVCFLDLITAGATAYGKAATELLYDTEIIRFSTTIGTNTIIQRDGSKIGMLLTRGAAALAPVTSNAGRRPLVEPALLRELDEAMSPQGEPLAAPAAAAIMEAAQQLIDAGARCLVVALDNSERNPAHERRVREVIKAEYPRDLLGSIPVFLASDISIRPGRQERINAAAINAYTHAKLVRLLYKAAEDLRQRHYRRTLFIAHNNGAVARVAKTRAINTYNSGPSAGLFGARMMGRLYGIDDLISVDMGGTSFDIGHVRSGRQSTTLHPDIEGFRCNLPMSAIRALGIGGGSIASLDGRTIRVGPQSAGAVPGPACFRLGGTKPTVTDANLLLGLLDPDFFLGGRLRLDVELARRAIEETLAKPLGISVDEAALGIRAAANRQMAEGVSETRRLFDGPPPALIAFGGGGALHACDIADGAGLDTVLLPRFCAVSSAFSLSLMDVGHVYFRPLDRELEQCLGAADLHQAVASMQAEAARDMRGEGFLDDPETACLQLSVTSDAASGEALLSAPPDFFATAEGIAGVAAAARAVLPSGRLIVASVGLHVQAAVPHFAFDRLPPATTPLAAARKADRPLLLDAAGGRVAVPVYDRDGLGNGHRLEGPAIVESAQTTLLVPPGWRCTIDDYDNAVLKKVGEP